MNRKLKNILRVIVITIASLIGIFLVVAYMLGKDLERKRKHHALHSAKQIVYNIKQALVHYAMDSKERCPKDLKELYTLQLIRKEPKDPWRENLIYKCPGEHDKNSADVSSKGPDRKADTADDIHSWEL